MNVVIRKARGFALIDLIFVCGIIGVLATVSLPRMLLARQAAGAVSAISSMRVIASAELTYALTCGGGFYAPNLTTLGAAPAGSREGFISPDLGSANTVQKSGYVLQLAAAPFAGSPASCNGLGPDETGQGYRAAADPLEASNVRYFGINSYGQIYENRTTLFAVMPELGQPPAGQPLR